MKDIVIYRFLKFKSKQGCVRGTTICKQLSIPLQQLPDLDYLKGIGSIGPINIRPMKIISDWYWYARCNAFMADFRFFFYCDNRPHMIKDRPFRKGIYNKPRREKIVPIE